MEISPLFALVARVKTADYDTKSLREIRDGIMSERFKRPVVDVKSFVKKLFSKHALEDLFFLKEKIDRIGDEKGREFMTLALMTAAGKVSYIYRDGGVVKVRKDIPRPPSLKKTFRRVVNMMIKDVEKLPLTDSKSVIKLGDARRLDFIDDELFDVVITSPPYLNKLEYTSVYGPEYELFMGGATVNPLRSYIGLRPNELYAAEDTPPAAYLYFKDMGMALAEMYRVLKEGGRAVLVVGGGVFPDRVLDVDVKLAEIAVEKGFDVERIIAVNKRVATTRRVIKIGWSRESILLLSK